jgi:hypothetical protein
MRIGRGGEKILDHLRGMIYALGGRGEPAKIDGDR